MFPADGARAARSTISRTVFSGTAVGKNARHEYRVAMASRTSIGLAPQVRPIVAAAAGKAKPSQAISRPIVQSNPLAGSLARKNARKFFDRSAAEISGHHNHRPLGYITRKWRGRAEAEYLVPDHDLPDVNDERERK